MAQHLFDKTMQDFHTLYGSHLPAPRRSYYRDYPPGPMMPIECLPPDQVSGFYNDPTPTYIPLKEP